MVQYGNVASLYPPTRGDSFQTSSWIESEKEAGKILRCGENELG